MDGWDTGIRRWSKEILVMVVRVMYRVAVPRLDLAGAWGIGAMLLSLLVASVTVLPQAPHRVPRLIRLKSLD